MPFASKAQRGYMFAKHPKIAERWAHEYPNQKDLPEHVKRINKIKRALKGK